MACINGMLAEVAFYEVAELLTILVPILLYAVYKTISRILKYRKEKFLIEKGIIRTRCKHTRGPKWIRSIYMGVFLILASSPFTGYCAFKIIAREDIEPQFYFLGILASAAGIAYLIRGILRRNAWKYELSIRESSPQQV